MKATNTCFLIIFFGSLAFGHLFYSIDDATKNLSLADVNTLTDFPLKQPTHLYHWISISSLKKLLTRAKVNAGQLPLKSLGNDNYVSILVRDAPMYKDIPGLFTWHNPIGATVGGSNEIYGNNEAVLALKLRPGLRVGLLITEDGYSQDPKLSDPSLVQRYDIILHVNTFVLNNELLTGLHEWILLNPNSVESFTADPRETAKVMAVYENELKKLKPSKKVKGPLISILAGTQHEGISAYSIDAEHVAELSEKILKLRSKIPEIVNNGWVPTKNFCRKFYK